MKKKTPVASRGVPYVQMILYVVVVVVVYFLPRLCYRFYQTFGYHLELV